MPASSDMLTNLFHLAFFGVANAIFGLAVYNRLKLISKGQPVNDLAPWGARIRSFLLNVILQHKLYKNPWRGLMHAFIFYGFISYLVHTTSQMVAGNGWAAFRANGVNPYEFFLTDYTQFLPLTGAQAALAIVGLVALLAVTFGLMHTLKLGKKNNWRSNAGIQWLFVGILMLEFLAVLAVVIGSGTPVYEAVVQYFSLLVLTGCAFFATRRWIMRAQALDIPSAQSAIVLILISTLMVSTLVSGAAQSYLDGMEHAIWINHMVLAILGPMGMDNMITAEAVRNFAWWLHIGTVYVFMVFVPMSKHSHLLFAPINFLLVRKKPYGAMNMMDLESETAVWGSANVSELPWPSLLDGMSCIECGRCTVECPANRTGKPLDPKKIVVDVKHAMLENWNNLMAQTDESGPAESRVIGDPYITEEELWACTSCHACVEACPVGNNQMEAILEMRRSLVLTESRFPQELQVAFQNMENNSNPWGIGAHSRADWCADLGVKTLAEDSKVDVLYWVGCAGSFDDRNKTIARSFVKVMQNANVNFAILGTEENCTGDSARRGGNEYLYQTLAQSNIDTMNNYGVKKIVTACPHCFNALKNEYPQMGGNYEVQHHSDFIDDLLRDGKLEMDEHKVEAMSTRRAVYHDSCYLGRYNEVFEQPRDLVRKATGLDIMEASDHHRTSLCCGAGGAQMWMEEQYERVNMKRTQQLVDTGADMIATACPFCITMITDGVKNKSLEQDVRVLDVAEIVSMTMKGGDAALPTGGFASTSSH